MTSPYMNLPDSVAAIDEKLPTAVTSLLMQAAMEERPLSECLEQRIAFWLSEFDDIKALYQHPRTRHLFEPQAGNLYGARIGLDNMTNELSGVHDRPSPALRLVPSTIRRDEQGAA